MFDLFQSYLFPWREFFVFLSFAFGACIGSFLNVCIYRIPRELSVVKPRSFCPNCNTPIPWYNNIPLFTYLFLRGKSKCCDREISFRYFLVEAITAVLFLLVWLKFDLLPGSRALGLVPITDWRLVPVYWLVVSGLILGTFVDFEHLIIPDRVTLGGIVSGIILSFALPSLHLEDSHIISLLYALLGTLVGGGMLWGLAIFGKMLFHKDAMGFGDVKLLGALGAFLGTKAVFFNVLISSLIGSIAGVSLILAKKQTMQSRIPYGPYIAFAAIIWILWGTTIWDAYINMFIPPEITPPDPTIISPNPQLYIN
ncbi:MAG: prepilin peptidase [Kiritimatiellae bacterium]|nr:prepilin peptidase [Kiritimatiellia bacterium]MDD5521066.1 prepilin peptidase [Kiritimatiellia bacterium]